MSSHRRDHLPHEPVQLAIADIPRRHPLGLALRLELLFSRLDERYPVVPSVEEVLCVVESGLWEPRWVFGEDGPGAEDVVLTCSWYHFLHVHDCACVCLPCEAGWKI